PNENLRILAVATDELEEEIMSEPTEQPPPLKKRRIYREDSVNPSVSSKQDMDLEMATEQLLDSFSQQDDAIEFRHRAMASCIESSTNPLLTMGDNFRVEELEDTWSGEHLGVFDFFDTVPTIVTVEEPSQVSEGKSDSVPNSLYGSFSPLPGLTPLAPLRDFPLAVITGESGRQLRRAVTEAIQLSIPNDTTVRVEEISNAGTSLDPSVDKSNWKLVLSDVRQTQSDTPARELSDKHMSESQERAPTDTYRLTHTLDQDALLAQIASLKSQLQQAQAEKTLLQAQVAERSTSSSSTSVNN
ncbi:hypothetical protein AXD71_14935, partial [Listeria monocytogenes]